MKNTPVDNFPFNPLKRSEGEVDERTVTFHPKQMEVFNFETQFAAAIAGVQSGKTFVGAHWAHRNIVETPGDGLIAAPTYKILRQSTLQKFFQEFPYLRQYYRAHDSVIEIPISEKETKTVYLRSFDRPYGVEGITLDWAWLDEAGQMSSTAWIVIKSRVSVTKGKILITTTPYNMGWLYQDFYVPWKDREDPRLSVFTWKSIENPFFDKEHYRAEKRALSTEEFRRRYEGEFTRMTGLVYELDEANFIHREKKNYKKVIGGIDWGFHNPALSVIGLTEEGYEIIDEWSESEKTTDEVIDAAKDLQRVYSVNRWYADSANPENIKQANKGTGLYVIPFRKKQNTGRSGNKRSSIEHGVSLIRQLIREHRLKIIDDLKGHISEFESYHYPEGIVAENKQDIPVAENNHYMDAMRYSIIGDGPVGRFQPQQIMSKFGRLLSLREKQREKMVEYIHA